MPAGRKTKYTPEIHKQIVDLIATGNTIKATCAYVGISDETFRRWLEKVDFLADIERAKGQAHIGAVFAIRSAIQGQQETSTITETFSETRLDKNGEEYTYKRTTTKNVITNVPADWRAAIDYLKRRDPEHWSDKLNITLDFGMTPDKVNAILRILAEAGVEKPGDELEAFAQEFHAAKLAHDPDSAT